MMNCFDETRNAFRPGKPWRAKTGILLVLVLGVLFGACSDSEKVSGTSEEAEGIVAITNKQIAGVAQKGPFVKGSNIVLRETSAAGNLKPTGKAFFATTRSDSGDFVIDGINLESQYVRLTATGYYKRESTDENSECQVSLNALSDVSDGNRININMFTHIEYARVLKLMEKGKSFHEAKNQAHAEWEKIIGDVPLREFEYLNIEGNEDDDKALKLLSTTVDGCAYNDNEDIPSDKRCTVGQDFIDAFANSFGSSGKIPTKLKVKGYPEHALTFCMFAIQEIFEGR